MTCGQADNHIILLYFSRSRGDVIKYYHTRIYLDLSTSLSKTEHIGVEFEF